MKLLTLNEVAIKLKISKASVKNWEKQGYIKPLHNKMYSPNDVDDLNSKLENGKIVRLHKRANKSQSKSRFIPTEYISNEESLEQITEIVSFIKDNYIKPEQALFLLSVNALVKTGEIEKENLYNALTFADVSYFKRSNVFNELKDWFHKISKGNITRENKYCRFLLESKLPSERDILGIIYQSIIIEGKKSSLGSYYTPAELVDQMIMDNIVDTGKVLDPCCGTGQFLLKLADRIENPNRIWGSDIDSIAVRITRVNLFLFYKDIDFKPNVFNKNSLLDWDEKGFSLIATNPPWGAKIDKNNIKFLQKLYPEVESKESFSYFIAFTLKYLKEGGLYSFVLPESILYVKNHRDIRGALLNKTSLTRIYSGGRMFKKVFSSVIRLDGILSKAVNNSVVDIDTIKDKYCVKQSRFLSNHYHIIDIYCSNRDQRIINSLYSFPHMNLEGKASWALGIVTGNNNLHIKERKDEEGMEPIYRGKDIGPLKLKAPVKFIKFHKESYQQCAPESFFRSKEKLIYKFISGNLVFAYDDSGVLTLNSANLVIPELDEYPVKAIGALFNSKLYQFVYKKKFNALKVLRGDIEKLPIPTLEETKVDKLNNLADSYIKGKIPYTAIDDFVFKIFSIEESDKEYIINFLEN